LTRHPFSSEGTGFIAQAVLFRGQQEIRHSFPSFL
jgi:hypothetical protein